MALTTGCAAPSQQSQPFTPITTVYIPAVAESSLNEWDQDELRTEKKTKDPACLPVSKVSYLKVMDYHEGFAVAQDKKGWLYIDTNGNPISEDRFDYAESFNKGLAPVNKNGELFYVDYQMKKKERPEDGQTDADINTRKFGDRFDNVSAFKDGLASATIRGNCYFIDEQGTIAFQEDPKWIYTDFREGFMAVFKRKDNQGAHVDKTGAHIYQDTYDFVDNFSEGLAAVNKNNDWYHITPFGNPAYTERFDYAGDFEGGLAVARTDKKWFHIKTDGGPAYSERFDYTGDFEGGLAVARTDKKWFHIGKSGNPYPNRKPCIE